MNKGKPTIIEEGIAELCKEAHDKGLMSATTVAAEAIAETEVSFIVVGTPSSPEGHLNLNYIYTVAGRIGRALKEKKERGDIKQMHLVAIRSTVLPGTNQKVGEIIAEESGLVRGVDFTIVSNPEFLREGTSVEDYFNPPLTLIGTDSEYAELVFREMYKDIKAEFICTDIKVAEMMKYVNNTYHALKIVFGNEVGNICKSVNVDSHKVMEIFCKDKQLNISPYYFKPGFAYGGSCLPKDLKALKTLAHDNDVDVPVIESIFQSNENQKKRAIQLIMNQGQRKVGILGLSFKAGTDDLRCSPIVDVVEALLGKVPVTWIDMLRKQGEYVSHCCWKEKAVMEFGDDDEGKIIDLRGGDWHNFNYLQQFVSLLTGCRFSSFENVEENIIWLFSDEEEIKDVKNLPLYNNKESRCFSIGGNTFLRDSSDHVLIGIDHAELGFGTIAAHGHADALSVQMMVDGKVILADPGTFIYHCNLPMRNEFRKTVNHNTIAMLDDNGNPIDQSQMLGAFLWGKRAHCTLENFQTSSSVDTLTASHDGYLPFRHQRTVEFIGKDTSKPILRVKDAMGEGKWVATWMLGADCSVKEEGEEWTIKNDGQIVVLSVGTDVDRIAVEDVEVSEEYGVKRPSKAIRIYGSQPVLSVDFMIIINK